MANPQRSTLKLGDKPFYTGKPINLNYEPKIGLSVFEVLPGGATHPGTSINNLVDVSGKSTQEIVDVVKSLDPRAVTGGVPIPLAEEIKAGNISHIFTTDPTESGGFMNLSAAEQQNVIDNTKGSVYFRNKEGKTARWKLPEISSSDSGWGANIGHGTFSDQTVYLPDEDKMSLAGAEATKKRVTRGALAAEDVDPRLLSESVVDDIVARKKQTIGFGEALRGDAGNAARGAVTQSVAPAAAPIAVPVKADTPTTPATTPVKAGTPTTSSTSVASRTNVASTTVTPPPAQAGPAPGPLTPPRVVTSGTQSGSAQVTGTITSTPPPSPSSAGAKAVDDLIEETVSSGAPTKSTTKLRSLAQEASEKVAKGGNLKLVGLGAIVGIGALGISRSRTNQDNINRRLDMQRGEFNR